MAKNQIWTSGGLWPNLLVLFLLVSFSQGLEATPDAQFLNETQPPAANSTKQTMNTLGIKSFKQQNHLEQSSDEFDTQIDYQFSLINSFLQGFKATTFVTNTNICSGKAQLTANNFNQTIYDNIRDEVEEVQKKVFDVTFEISTSLADAVGECYFTVYGFWLWGVNLVLQFETTTDFISAALQNIVGNVISLNQLYQNILDASAANETQQVWFYIGRIFYLLVDIKPITVPSLLDNGGYHEDNLMALQELIAKILVDQGPFQKFLLQLNPSPLQQDVVEYQFPTITSIYLFIGAFFNATISEGSPNANLCQESVFELQAGIVTLIAQFESFLYEEAGFTLELILGTVYPISFSCYEGLFEFLQVLAGYYQTIINPKLLLYNMIHNFGRLYDTIESLVRSFVAIDNTNPEWWRALGTDFGAGLNYLLYEPQDFDKYEPEEVQSVESNKRYYSD